MTSRSIILGLGLSFLLMSIAGVAVRNKTLKKTSVWQEVNVQMAEPESAIPPGFWIEYDPVERHYRSCHEKYGTRSCWLTFNTREEAIRDARVFADYLKRATKE